MLRRALLLTLALLAAGPLAVSETTDPVNLGATGLALEVRLYAWDGAAWSTADASGITTTELGNAKYFATLSGGIAQHARV